MEFNTSVKATIRLRKGRTVLGLLDYRCLVLDAIGENSKRILHGR